MSDFPDPDFTALRQVGGARQVGTATGGVEGGVKAGANRIATEGDSPALTRRVESLHEGAAEAGRTTTVSFAVAAAGDAAAQLASQWESSAPKDPEIDEAVAHAEHARQAMAAAYKFGTPPQQAATTAAATAAKQQAQSLQAQRAAADEAFSTGLAAEAGKVREQRAANSKSKIITRRPTAPVNPLGVLKPTPPRNIRPNPSAPPLRTPAGTAPGAGTAPRTNLSNAKPAMPQMPQVTPQALAPQGQPQPQEGQGQPQPAAAGGAPTAAPATAKPADKKKQSNDATPLASPLSAPSVRPVQRRRHPVVSAAPATA